MKVLLCSDSYYPHPGGVSEYMYFLGAHLRKLGNDVVILAPRYLEPYEDDVHTKRIGRCYLFKANRATITTTFHHKLPILVRNFMKGERFDVVHTNGPLGWSLPYWAFHYSRAVNVVTFHTAFTGINFHKLAKVFFKGIFRKKMHGAIYPSRTALRTTYPHFPTPCRIIPNGIDTARFNPGVKPLNKFPSGSRRILFLGRLDARKGLDRILLAYPKIKSKISNAILIIVGSGSSVHHYKKAVPGHLRNSVFFEGKVHADLIPRYYASCDVYVSPATGGEVFGIVLTEAMAMQKPVIASNIPGYNEVIRDGTNGLLFDHNDPENIADKVIHVLRDSRLRNSLSTNGRRFAQKLSWQNIAKQVLDYYETLHKDVHGYS